LPPIRVQRPTGPELEALRLSPSVALRGVLASLPLAMAIAQLLTRRRFAGRTLLDAFVHLPLVCRRSWSAGCCC
jgi:molybdate transport system permease protein